ncbi:hypothetical protein RhiirA1_469988 [Rhizophagus irregularis]|uniref:Uncharacterized protein n=1 Tax=Rhizophagus irregularis TaxID=588596 RepID=A0A2N0R6Z2_9GLOM|nr:hypothetical protein RhiirA1_469988 [Rhizophagus irregularis]
MIFPASFKHAQKIKKNLSFTRLVLSFSTLRTLVLPFSCPLRSVDLFQQSFPDSSTTTPHILITTDTSDSDISAPLSVSPLNCTPADFLPSVSASALPYDNTQHSSYTFMLRTILDGWIQPARNVGSNYWSKFSQHVVHSDLLDSSMWMATKEHAVVIPPFSYNLTMSTTDYSIVLSVYNLISSRPDVSFCLKERSHHFSVVFVSSKFTGSIQKVVLNPSSVVTSNLITDKPNSGPFVSLNCPTINYQDFKTLGFSCSIINMPHVK